MDSLVLVVASHSNIAHEISYNNLTVLFFFVCELIY